MGDALLMSEEHEFGIITGTKRGRILGHIPYVVEGRELFMSVRMHHWLGPITPVPPMD